MDLQRIGNCLSKLQTFYEQQLSAALQEDFIEYCVDNFTGVAQVEKAVSLLIATEPNYGRMPHFGRLKEVLNDYLQTNRPEYQPPNPKILSLPGTVESEGPSYKCLCCLDSGPLSAFVLSTYLNIHDSGVSPYPYQCGRCWASSIPVDLVRKVTKSASDQIHEAELSRRQIARSEGHIPRLKAKVALAAYLNRRNLRDEAIAEAKERGIALAQIGIEERVTA